MFRIEKRLIQEASPAQIPLIPVQAAQTSAGVPPQLVLPEQAELKLPPEAKRAVDNLLQQAAKEAEAKLAAAAQQAEAKLAAAEQEAKSILEKAKQNGQQEGKKEGLQLYQEQMRAAQQQLSSLLAEIAQTREAFYDSFEGEMVDLALAIAEKIVNTAINKEDTAFQSMIENALKQMRREGKITIRVSEEQYNAFFQAESATFVLGDESVRASIVNDPLLSSGDLILESDGETINASAASQLKYIALAFGRPYGEQ